MKTVSSSTRKRSAWGTGEGPRRSGCGNVHVIAECLEVLLLLGKLLLELEELLLLTLADGVVLAGLLALLESVAVISKRDQPLVLMFDEEMDEKALTYPWPPDGLIEPVSPALQTRAVMEKAR